MPDVIVMLSVIIGLLRIVGVTSPAFQAIAHLFVGGLIGGYLVNRDKFLIYMVVLLTVVETAVFVWTRILN